MNADSLWNDIESIRRTAPLVHNITNYVVMNSTANALLALGASPIMAHALEEMESMTAISGALVINIGTLSKPWIESMHAAASFAARRGLPVILDPVGAGASALRTDTARALLQSGAVRIVRGNASEIAATAGQQAQGKGVDSLMDPEAAAGAARDISRQFKVVLSVSGPVDLITDGTRVVRVANGHPLMTRVTGLGCTASALTGAFAAVNPDPLAAAAHAMATMGIAGEIAAAKSAGPGTLQVHFIDALYQLDQATIARHLRSSEA